MRPPPTPRSVGSPRALLSRTLLGTLLAGLVLLGPLGCGGSAGVSGSSFLGSAGVANGTLVGTVFAVVGGAGIVPAADVTVTAERQSFPFQVRRTRTDASGGYLLGDLPLGEWRLSFQARGLTSEPSVRVFVESGGLSVAPDVTLGQTASAGSAAVRVLLVDDATGAGVTGATVTLGGFSPSRRGADGSYEFRVPASLDPFTGSPRPLPLFVQHPSFGATVPVPSSLTPVPGATVVRTVVLAATATLVQGQLRASSQDSLYASSGAFGTLTISSPQVAPSFLAPSIDPSTGFFQVQVPPSTSGSGLVDLVFTSPLFEQAVVRAVRAPGPGGVATLSSPVTLTPRRATLAGVVVNSAGQGPTGFPNQVVIVETGQAATPVNGSFALSGVPVGFPLTLRATVQGPFGVETATAVVTPVGGGSFQVPPLVTR